MTANTHTNQRRVGKNWLSMGVNHGGRQGDESPRICSGGANAKKLSSDFQKNTAQNSPKHAISSEKFFFFLGRGLALPPMDSTPCPNEAFWMLLCIPQKSSRIDAYVVAVD